MQVLDFEDDYEGSESVFFTLGTDDFNIEVSVEATQYMIDELVVCRQCIVDNLPCIFPEDFYMEHKNGKIYFAAYGDGAGPTSRMRFDASVECVDAMIEHLRQVLDE